jgi:hypothetical protein
MLSAPLIVRTSEAMRSDTQEIFVFLKHFSFRVPDEVFGSLVHNGASAELPGANPNSTPDRAMAALSMNAKEPMGLPAQGSTMKMDLNDVEFDAFLANARTLDVPKIIRVERGGRIRLRIINGAWSTNIHIDVGQLQGSIVAVDGNAVKPMPDPIPRRRNDQAEVWTSNPFLCPQRLDGKVQK